MKRVTKTPKALGALTDTSLGDSTNVVRTLKVAGRDQVMQIMDYLDNMEEEFSQLM